jgi:hypothetical protein
MQVPLASYIDKICSLDSFSLSMKSLGNVTSFQDLMEEGESISITLWSISPSPTEVIDLCLDALSKGSREECMAGRDGGEGRRGWRDLVLTRSAEP